MTASATDGSNVHSLHLLTDQVLREAVQTEDVSPSLLAEFGEQRGNGLKNIEEVMLPRSSLFG